MVQLLEIKEKIMNYYKKYEKIILIFVKFILAYIVIANLNTYLGLNEKLSKGIVTLGLSAISAFIPGSWFVLLLVGYISGHIYKFSLEALAIVFVVMMIVYLLFIRVFPKQAYFVVLVPLAFIFKVGYLIPLMAGIFAGPTSIVSIGAGVLVYKGGAYLPEILKMESAELYDIPETVVNMSKYLLDSIMHDKAMMLIIAVFAMVVVVEYIITRFSFDYIWYIAIGAGAIVNILAFIIGVLMMDADISIGGVILGTLIGALITAFCQFMRFSLDYNRQEKVQFEDEDFYYYVKAIPKTKIAKAEKEVKKIK